MIYELLIAFVPNRRNYARKGGFGAWVVHRCDTIWADVTFSKPFEVSNCYEDGHAKLLCMSSVRPYNRKALVNPAKIALQYAEFKRRAQQQKPDIEHGIIYFGRAAA